MRPYHCPLCGGWHLTSRELPGPVRKTVMCVDVVRRYIEVLGSGVVLLQERWLVFALRPVEY